MDVIIGLEAFKKNYPETVLTIGNYDGVHLGHQKILAQVIQKAKEIQGTSIVMTFDPHPVKVLAPERDIRLLTTSEEKTRLIEAAGIDVLLFINFNREFAGMLPDDFVQTVLVEKLRVREIIVGTNYTFGKQKKGTIDLLRRRGEKYGFEVKAVRQVMVHGNIVSSSAIRNLLLKGAVAEAANYLGRPYSIEGKVIKGKGRGQSLLHVPTANITSPVEIAPREGVYAVRIGMKGKMYDGVANIGKNPTFGNQEVSYEVHIFNFSGNLLGRDLRMYFIDRIRGERAFPDVDRLVTQIRQDMDTAREILEL
ncbi:MAG: bifunctional riboflavin kinase/FAD synthetase [Nitrospirota bacterium]